MSLIGTSLVEDLVQTVALSHLIEGRDRVGLLLLASPESGKTTIATAATCKHVKRVVIVTARSVMQLATEREIEFLLFNDMAMIRSLSKTAAAFLINTLNQITQGEYGDAMFAGSVTYRIERQLGMIGCMPFSLFVDRRSHWRNMGFISRMLTFAYSYPAELITTIKDGIDRDQWKRAEPKPMPSIAHASPIHISMAKSHAAIVRRISDLKAQQLDVTGIRLLKNYHSLIRAHALRHGRTTVTRDDVDFLRAVDSYISITECKPL